MPFTFRLLLLLTISAAPAVNATGTKDCFAPKSVESECKKVTPDVLFLNFSLKQTQSVLEQKNGQTHTVNVPVTGKRIVFFDEDKAYTVQINDMDQAAEGQILSLGITTRVFNGVPSQKNETSRSKAFYLAKGKVTSSVVNTSFILQFLSETAFEGKSLLRDNETISSAMLTSDYAGSKEVAKDGTETINYSNPGLDVDLKNGFTLKSLAISGTNRPTQARQFTNLLGEKVQTAINDFVGMHVAVLQLRKELNHCKSAYLNCTLAEQNLLRADRERDYHFLEMIQAADLKVRPAPAVRAEPAPQVEVRQRCPMPPKTQFPNAVRYYYYYDMNGDCVVVSPFGPFRGTL